MDRVVFNPFSPLVLLIFFGLLILVGLAVIVFPVLFLTAIGATFAKLGFSWWQAFLILLLTLIGSFINIPVRTLATRPAAPAYDRYVAMYGRLYRIPQQVPRTVLAINVGGALIPLAISLYLLYDSVVISGGYRVMGLALLGVAFVTVITKLVARPVPGLGIATPFFIPPLAALFAALILSLFAGGVPAAAVIIAYVSGTLGTLVGADLLNLHHIAELGAPTASIGGRGRSTAYS
jgi:Predicted membrane protein